LAKIPPLGLTAESAPFDKVLRQFPGTKG